MATKTTKNVNKSRTYYALACSDIKSEMSKSNFNTGNFESLTLYDDLNDLKKDTDMIDEFLEYNDREGYLIKITIERVGKVKPATIEFTNESD